MARKARAAKKGSGSAFRATRGSKNLPFSVDAALFQELGERLVGQPHIALAELIKNAYDADATEVRVRFIEDGIEVTDNGNGMNFEQFRGHWMRVGSPHKQGAKNSPRFRRPLTGSKGVGRLAVQFLARRLELRTTSRGRNSLEIRAAVDWTEAIQAGEVTEAIARYDERPAEEKYVGDSQHGTQIVLTDLQHRWVDEELEALAREIWWLQPPFQADPHLSAEAKDGFRVVLEHAAEGAARRFDEQMRAVLDHWHARVVGKLTRPEGRGSRGGRVGLTLEFNGGVRHPINYTIENCALASADFEVRVYALSNRQGSGVRVEEARKYFREFGGVHVYDAGFHLPYYGPDTDWLRIEIDHSHRLSRSKLLPRELQVANGMNNLPTQSRLFGVVHVDTSAEHSASAAAHRRDYLKIQVSRDRLVDNLGFDQLRDAVRWSLDYYAMQETRRKFREAESRKPPEPPRKTLTRIGKTLDDNRNRMPGGVYSALREGVRDASRAATADEQVTARRMGMLGALATAGMTALAYEQELRRELGSLEEIAKRIEKSSGARSARQDQRGTAKELRDWIKRVNDARGLFAHIADDEHRRERMRFRARSFVEDVRDSMLAILAGVPVDVSGVGGTIRLPEGTHAEWTAVFQNLLMNAAHAVRDAETREVVVSSRKDGDVRQLVVQDTGTGMDLSQAERFFEPFIRGAESKQSENGKKPLGAGLGLTIVRMISGQLGADVRFVRPDAGFATALQLSWPESE